MMIVSICVRVSPYKVLFDDNNHSSTGVNNTNGFFVHLDTIGLVCVELIRIEKAKPPMTTH